MVKNDYVITEFWMWKILQYNVIYITQVAIHDSIMLSLMFFIINEEHLSDLTLTAFFMLSALHTHTRAVPAVRPPVQHCRHVRPARCHTLRVLSIARRRPRSSSQSHCTGCSAGALTQLSFNFYISQKYSPLSRRLCTLYTTKTNIYMYCGGEHLYSTNTVQ